MKRITKSTAEGAIAEISAIGLPNVGLPIFRSSQLTVGTGADRPTGAKLDFIADLIPKRNRAPQHQSAGEHNSRQDIGPGQDKRP